MFRLGFALFALAAAAVLHAPAENPAESGSGARLLSGALTYETGGDDYLDTVWVEGICVPRDGEVAACLLDPVQKCTIKAICGGYPGPNYHTAPWPGPTWWEGIHKGGTHVRLTQLKNPVPVAATGDFPPVKNDDLAVEQGVAGPGKVCWEGKADVDPRVGLVYKLFLDDKGSWVRQLGYASVHLDQGKFRVVYDAQQLADWKRYYKASKIRFAQDGKCFDFAL